MYRSVELWEPKIKGTKEIVLKQNGKNMYPNEKRDNQNRGNHKQHLSRCQIKENTGAHADNIYPASTSKK